MPELPEVETVKETLKKKILNQKIIGVNVYYDKVIEYPDVNTFTKEIVNQTVNDIQRKGKWLMFVLDDYFLFSHLRMEGKYRLADLNSPNAKHNHIEFIFKDKLLRYFDTRKFGKMLLVKKEEANNQKPLNKLGLEPWDLTSNYLKEKYKQKKIAIKTALLDQTIITGIGNIYADEILFLSKINPLKPCNKLTLKEIDNIITNTQKVMEEAIKMGGTTIHSFSSDGINGEFQQQLLVHTKKVCPICNSPILKIKVNGRGTYYCPKCQK